MPVWFDSQTAMMALIEVDSYSQNLHKKKYTPPKNLQYLPIFTLCEFDKTIVMLLLYKVRSMKHNDEKRRLDSSLSHYAACRILTL